METGKREEMTHISIQSTKVFRNESQPDWITDLVHKLTHHGFEGTLMLDFHKGAISRKYRLQQVGYADEVK
ncbi:MAG: hypothetical protein EHM49_00920 [Deltaproteobacteria bacterium]|nr:MAG: hypothetical protein EHM49_00920 [Deltaproteobacteria bacterium]